MNYICSKEKQELINLERFTNKFQLYSKVNLLIIIYRIIGSAAVCVKVYIEIFQGLIVDNHSASSKVDGDRFGLYL